MLIVSRKLNESVIIGHDIRVCVVEIKGGKVRLGIEADASVPVHREEVYESILRNAAALLALLKTTDGDAWTENRVLVECKSDSELLSELREAMVEVCGFIKNRETV